MTDTAKQASQFDTVQMSVDVFMKLTADNAALREEVERLHSIVKQLPEFIDHIGSSIYDWERVAQELREAALREGR